jgi:AcrR family transcriptional regulator
MISRVKLTQKSRRRRKGRPSGVGEGVGREGLIRAAIDLLRSHAPATLRLTDVARFAGVDPNLIRYYFKDKDGLFTAAASTMLEEFRLKQKARAASKGTAEERLRDRIRSVIEQYLQHPYFHEVVVNQIIRGDPRSGKRRLQALADSGEAEVHSIITQGAKTGEFRSVDARFLQLAVVGACGFFVTARPLVEASFKGQKVTTATAEAYGDFVADLLIDGLKRPEKYRKPPVRGARARRTKA